MRRLEPFRLNKQIPSIRVLLVGSLSSSHSDTKLHPFFSMGPFGIQFKELVSVISVKKKRESDPKPNTAVLLEECWPRGSIGS